MVSYYAGSRPYRERGAPLLPLRLLAPVLAVTTLGILGIALALSLTDAIAGWQVG